MTASRQHLCDICFVQHITEDAQVWCPECEENFCEKCKIHHDIAKATRKHEIISIENVLKLPRFVQKLKINCSDHDERFVYVCSEHETPCCVKCIKTKHIECRNLTPIETVVKDIKQSPSFLDLETTLSDLLTNITNFVEDRKANLQGLKEQKRQCEGDMQSAREAINTYFDELEADLNNKMQQAFVKEETEIKICWKTLNLIWLRNIETILLKVKLECKIPYEYEKQQIMDGGVLPNGELIFCDKKKSRLIIMDSDGDVVRNIMLTFCPIRSAIIDENSIAVTTADKVNIVDLKTGQVLKSFAEGLKARSILLHNRNFIIENLGKGYIIADLQGNTVKSLPINFPEFLYHHPIIINDKLYYAEQDGSEVVCLDLEGNQLWKIKDERLVSPYGMTSDNSNLLFVCGIKSNNVFVISADGKTFKEIVAPNEHLNGAISAYFNKIKQELLIVTQNGNVSVYHVI
ncbi:unnamed protein product [Mytilus coruscus]|uniref:B box-type domain-containing protein n=1 Tax=Mytilus coruscus TaxID=42192 RepID=A0A6J8F4X4_MYTCO|nr:unnamed protein product [Mytilus coruscus]